MKRYLKKEYIYAIAIVLFAVTGMMLYKKHQGQYCGPCKEKGVVIKKGKVKYDKEMHRKLFRAKKVAAAIKASKQPQLA